jgi:hypothetical protein
MGKTTKKANQRAGETAHKEPSDQLKESQATIKDLEAEIQKYEVAAEIQSREVARLNKVIKAFEANKYEANTETQPEDEPQTLKWKNTGGSLRLANGKKIKTNEVFEATEDQIPRGARDVIIPMSQIPQPPPNQSVTAFEIVEKKGGWYFVVNKVSRKAVNENALRKAEAEALLEELSQ